MLFRIEYDPIVTCVAKSEINIKSGSCRRFELKSLNNKRPQCFGPRNKSPVTCDRTLFLGQKNIQQKFGKSFVEVFLGL